MYNPAIMGGNHGPIFKVISGKWPSLKPCVSQLEFNITHATSWFQNILCLNAEGCLYSQWLIQSLTEKKFFSSFSQKIKTKIKITIKIFTSLALEIFMKWIGEKIQKWRLKFKQLFSSKLSAFGEKKIFKNWSQVKTMYNQKKRSQLKMSKKCSEKVFLVYDSSIFKECLLLFFLFLLQGVGSLCV